MEKITGDQDNRLLDYLDGRLDGTGLAQLKNELETFPAVKARLEQLRIVHRTLAHTKLETPSAMFTEKVMKNLHVSPPQSSLSPRNGLFLLAGVIVAAGILMTIMGSGVFDGFKETVPLDGPSQLQKYIQPSLHQI